jgi:hypothetical protein
VDGWPPVKQMAATPKSYWMMLTIGRRQEAEVRNAQPSKSYARRDGLVPRPGWRPKSFYAPPQTVHPAPPGLDATNIAQPQVKL